MTLNIMALASLLWPQTDRLGAETPAAEPRAVSSAAAAFATFAEDYWDAQMRLSPLSATFNGYPRYHDLLDDNSVDGRRNEQAEVNRLSERLAGIDRASLSPSERISYDIARLQMSDRIESFRHRFYQFDVDHMDGPQSVIPLAVETAQPMRTAADAENLIKRMKAMPRYFANQAGNLREGLAAGRVACRTPVQKTIRQLEEQLNTPPDRTSFAAAADKLPDDVRHRYKPLLLAAFDDSVRPAFRSYLDFLRDQYLDKTRPEERPGLRYVPGGDEAYLFDIRLHTTLDKSPEELHQTGLDELGSIQDEMRAVAGRMGYKGELMGFLEKIRDDPASYFKTREDILKTAEGLIERARAQLPRFFGALPKTPIVVKPFEEFREKNGGFAEYQPPPDDFSRPGIYYINAYKPQTRSRLSMASTTMHEGLPGHHMQLALALEERNLPAFRRHAGFTAFVEGWALYCERLGDEMGLYADDLSRLGMLSDQGLRAARLVVDTGLHAKGWSRRKAIDFMKKNLLMSEEEVESEVDRYIVWPGQALSYKVGQREIMALRKELAARLGDKFDLRAFHDAVLRNGAVPLPVLRRSLINP